MSQGNTINAANVANAEIGSVNQAQTKLHTDPKGIPLNHMPQIEKIAHGSKIQSPIKSNKEDDSHVYKPNHDLSILEALSITFETPEVALDDSNKATHRIRFDDNLMHLVLNFAELVIDKEVCGTLSLHILNKIRATEVPSNRRPLYDKMIGNTPQITGWKDCIPATKFDAPLLFDFATCPAKGIPLYRLARAGKTCTIRIKFLRNISELLICQELGKDGVWRDIPFSNALLKKTKDKVKKIKIPVLRGHYGHDTPEEIAAVDKEMPVLERIWEDYGVALKANPEKAGSAVTQDIVCTLAVRSYSILCVNKTATNIGYHSNYTMNPVDPVNGRNPVQSQRALANLTTPRTEETTDSYQALEAWYNGRSYPDRNGFNTIYFDKEPMNPQALAQTRSFSTGWRINYTLKTALAEESNEYDCMIIYKFYRTVSFDPKGTVAVQRPDV